MGKKCVMVIGLVVWVLLIASCSASTDDYDRMTVEERIRNERMVFP